MCNFFFFNISSAFWKRDSVFRCVCVCVYLSVFCEYINRWCWWLWRPEVPTGGLISSLVSRLCPPHLGPIMFVCMVMTGDVTTIWYQAECDLSFSLSVLFLSVYSFFFSFLFFFTTVIHQLHKNKRIINVRWFILEICCQKCCFCRYLHKHQSDKCWEVEEKKSLFIAWPCSLKVYFLYLKCIDNGPRITKKCTSKKKACASQTV